MKFQAGDRVLALEPATGHKWLLRAGNSVLKEKGLGVIDTDKLVGAEPGQRMTYGAKELVLMVPRLPDLARTLRRKAQIIGAKDASRIAYELGLAPGMRALESGIGSGATTMALAHAVGDTGEVVVQELRDDFADWATKNLQRAGLDSQVTVCIGDLTESVAPGVEGPFDAALLDQPQPWLALPNVFPLLAAGATIAVYTPNTAQLQQVHEALEGCADVRSFELIEREWVVRDHGTRPAFDGLGHTAFLTFARYLG